VHLGQHVSATHKAEKKVVALKVAKVKAAVKKAALKPATEKSTNSDAEGATLWVSGRDGRPRSPAHDRR
jgi:hypothetical protein